MQRELMGCFAVKMESGGLRRIRPKASKSKSKQATPPQSDPLADKVAEYGTPGSRKRIDAYRDSVTQDGPDGQIGLLP